MFAKEGLISWCSWDSTGAVGFPILPPLTQNFRLKMGPAGPRLADIGNATVRHGVEQLRPTKLRFAKVAFITSMCSINSQGIHHFTLGSSSALVVMFEPGQPYRRDEALLEELGHKTGQQANQLINPNIRFLWKLSCLWEGGTTNKHEPLDCVTATSYVCPLAAFNWELMVCC